MTILVGTASWTDKTLIACGRFYPKGATTAEARLRHYASLFPLVEVDSSYYAIPVPQTAQLWAERTPRGFVMNVKAFRLFTGHKTQAHVLSKDVQQALGAMGKRNFYYNDTPPAIRDELWRQFLEALAPLKAAGKLGLVHFQFAPWMLRNRESRAHVEHCVERMAGHTVSVEFRHGTWFDQAHRQATVDFERELGVVHTVVDGPQGFANSVPQVWAVTHPTHALVRLHGHNRNTWDIKGATSASDRFNYDYSAEELQTLAGRMRALEAEAFTVHGILNNNFEDQGQRNALTLMELLDQVRPAGGA
jgi:uncharacterized protein YecE (DUF72 family)